MIRWDELNGTEQLVYDYSMDEIEHHGITDKNDITGVFIRIAQDCNDANWDMGYDEEADYKKALSFMMQEEWK